MNRLRNQLSRCLPALQAWDLSQQQKHPTLQLHLIQAQLTRQSGRIRRH